MNRSIECSKVAFWPALNRGDDIIHKTINMGEACMCVGEGAAWWSGFWIWHHRLGQESTLYTVLFLASVNICEKAQKKLGESPYPIISTR